jgi:hypothetical protein
LSESGQEKLRLLFYLLLKAEILRETPEVFRIRLYAQKLSNQISSLIFQSYMTIEDSTQSRNKVYGTHVGVIASEGVKPTVSYSVRDGVVSVRYDAACRALGIDERRLSEKEANFLRRVTLKEMLEKHGIEYPVR